MKSPQRVYCQSLEDKTGMKFNYHVPTIYVYQKNESLKDIENKHH